MSELNFATSVTRVVRVDVTGDAFLRDTTSLSPVWEESVITLIETLETEPSVLRITYREADGDRVLASRRLKTLQTMLTQHWREKPNRYRLQIETSLLLGSP